MKAVIFDIDGTLTPGDCAVVGDGENDRLLFEASGRGVLLKRDAAEPASDDLVDIL